MSHPLTLIQQIDAWLSAPVKDVDEAAHLLIECAEKLSHPGLPHAETKRPVQVVRPRPLGSKVFEYVTAHGGCTAGEIAQALNFPRARIAPCLKQLEAERRLRCERLPMKGRDKNANHRYYPLPMEEV